MTSSNNNNYMLKSYLNFFKWVADKMHGEWVSLGKVKLGLIVFHKKIINIQLTCFHLRNPGLSLLVCQ